IHRPVFIYTTPNQFINKVKVDTKVLKDQKGKVDLEIQTQNVKTGQINIRLQGDNEIYTTSVAITGNKCSISIEMEKCRYWSNKDPFLYELVIQLSIDDIVIDEYHLNVGVREIKVDGNKLLLNGEEIYLTGFGKHEDFWVVGKGLFVPLLVKDFAMMKWINCNSFRTSHYPYSDEIMDYADRKGFLVIDEVPAVSLDLRVSNYNTLQNHKEFMRKLIERDYNHPCVIMWAAGNEPNLVGAESYYDGRAKAYWKEVFDYTKTLDSTRPVTVPNCQRAGVDDPVFEFSDVMTINRYYGWYEHPGQLEKAIQYMEREMDTLVGKYNKPLMVTEFGADTLQGMHSTSDQMFSEEYQTKIITMYIELFRKKDYMVGEHIWNFADFRTPMHFRRVVLNLKGVFTRERLPKSVAFALKQIWKD
ncbi:MAG: glycoside hydrolase family 2 TIM barrel-domain containing protein, partial [Ignavibacteria bacterium]